MTQPPTAAPQSPAKAGHSAVLAVVWDFGGVITSSPFEAFRRFELEHGLPVDFLRQVNSQNHLDNAWARFERSQLDLDAFDQAFADESAALGHSVRGREVVALLSGQIRPSMVAALKTLRTRLKIGLITNNMRAPGNLHGEAGAASAPSERAAVVALFHHVIESAEVGIRKPDPAIYQMMCDALQVAPPQAVFLDDLGVNLKPARAMGMHTIKVGEPGPALAQLQALVGFDLGAGV